LPPSSRGCAPAAVLELGSGPGWLVQRILESLGPLAHRVRFVESDFTKPDWHAGLPKYHAVVTLQAVHELRHKRHAASFYKAAGSLLLSGGCSSCAITSAARQA